MTRIDIELAKWILKYVNTHMDELKEDREISTYIYHIILDILDRYGVDISLI